MIIISHRGNLNGPEPQRENHPDYIDSAIKLGYDVEIDLRFKQGGLWLGHDEPQYLITLKWLHQRRDKIWIHVKDYDSLVAIIDENLRYFCHQSDDFTLISNGYAWVHDLSKKITKKCVIPLLDKESITEFKQDDFHAICTDYVYFCERNLEFKNQ